MTDSIKEKEFIKNSVVNMNISGNYSQMKSKINAGSVNSNNNNNSIVSKHSSNSIEEN